MSTTKDIPTVACVLFDGKDVPSHSRGIFTPEWVEKLYRGVKRNTSRSFEFVCYVDKTYDMDPNINQIQMTFPFNNMFSLLEPFQLDSTVLFMGLDTIIVGNIDEMLDYRPGKLMMTRDPDKPKIGCSGVMMFPPNCGAWELFSKKPGHWARLCRMCGHPSDMFFLANVPHGYLDDDFPGWCVSYKRHVKKNRNVLKKARIVYFHGREKPHEIQDPVLEHWI